jgi:membrane protease YdiL (CAAX protease family)
MTALAFEGGLGVIALVLGAIFGMSPLRTLTPSVTGIAIGAVAAVPMLVFFSALLEWQIAPLVRIRELLDEMIAAFFAHTSIKELALVSIAAGIGEELLFRGFVQGTLSVLMPVPLALVLASLLFGLAHAITRTYVVLATVFGIYLGWLWTASGNLLVPIVAHALYDFVALTALVRAERRKQESSDTPVDAAA